MVSFFANGDLVDPRTLLSRPRCVHRLQIPDNPGGLKNLKEDFLGGLLMTAQMVPYRSDTLLGVDGSRQLHHIDVSSGSDRGTNKVLPPPHNITDLSLLLV